MLAAGCTGIEVVNPVCQVGSLGGSLASSGFQDALNDISQWVASGAEWLLAQIGDVLVSTTAVNVDAVWFRTHYEQMAALAGVVILPLLLLSIIQAVLRQSPGQLVRVVLVQVPMALVLSGVAIQVVVLSLSATDAMSDAIAGGSGADVTSLLSGLTSGLVAAAGDPTLASFVLLLVALLIAVASFVLWLELLIRAAAVYVAVLFLPMALATLVWPAVSHWCKRLVETLAALILSKFVIVAVLSLAAGAVSSGTAGSGSHGAGFSSVLAGAALLVMATFVPFGILRLIPAMEAGAIGHLEGVRSRATGAMTRLPRSAAQYALQSKLQSAMQGKGAAKIMAATEAAAEGLGGGGGGGGGAGGGTSTGDAAIAEFFGPLTDSSPENRTGTSPENQWDDFVPPEDWGMTRQREGGLFQTPESQQMWDAYVAGKWTPPPLRPKGPKPIVGWREEGGGGTAGVAAGAGLDMGGLPGSWVPEPGGERRWVGATSSADAWKWKGVPEGYELLEPVEPGERRRCYGKEPDGIAHIKYLDAAWPPGDPNGAT